MSDPAPATHRPRICLLWMQFGPYIMDRSEAVATEFPKSEIIGIEIADKSAGHYAWLPQGAGKNFTKITLFQENAYDQAGWFKRTWMLIRGVVSVGARHNFLCHYNMSSVFVLALTLRLLGRRVFLMHESKFDDRARSVWQEILKWFFLLPYNGALVGGRRHREYLLFLGFKDRPIAEGYDTVSMARMRALSGVPPAPNGTPYNNRHFIAVARLIPKKNLPLVIAAYHLYRAKFDSKARNLIILGSGELEKALIAEVRVRNLQGVTFAGFVSDSEVSQHLGHALALILPSIEEQWGLVVNEALFLGVPILCSENVGARDTLVRNSLNGYIFNSDDVAGLARLMGKMASDEDRWRALAAAALKHAPAGDVSRFAEGARSLIEVVS